MIEVLRDWEQIGAAYRTIRRAGLPLHSRVEKNWDLHNLHRLILDHDRSSPIIDLGCGGLDTLRFLHALGFSDLHGIDITLRVRERLSGVKSAVKQMLRLKKPQRPFHLRQADIADTPYPDESFSMGTCISVIEHGVDVPRFLAECHRILRPGSLLVMTTDYSEDPPDVSHIRPFDLPWRIRTAAEISELTEEAARQGFRLLEDGEISSGSENPVEEFGVSYTFIFMAFVREG